MQRKGRLKMKRGKKNNILAQNKGLCQEMMSHFSLQDQETIQKNTQFYVPGPRLSHEQIMESLLNTQNESETKSIVKKL